MTKEEVLERTNNYCNERSYDKETLTDDFKDKFAEFFAKRHEAAGIDDDGILDEIKFNLDTAKSAAAKGITLKQTGFESRENDLKKQIDELNKRLEGNTPPPPPQISKELQDKLDELERFKNEQRMSELYSEILSKAKENVREDLHKSLEKYAKDFPVKMEDTSDAQAKVLVARFQEIFKDTIGNIKPLSPQVNEKQEDEWLGSLPKVKM
jgi:hypothetical protein